MTEIDMKEENPDVVLVYLESRSETFPKCSIIFIRYLLLQSFLSFLYGEGGGLALAGEESLRQLLALADKYLVEDLKVLPTNTLYLWE